MKNLFLIIPVCLTIFSVSVTAAPSIKIQDTVVKMAIAEDVSFDDAVSSMKLRANSHNMKLVAELPLSKQIESMGKKSRRMGIYQFCDALMAQQMVKANIHFAAYLPCRIALVEDEKGKGWLLMMDLDIMIKGAALNKNLKKNAIKVRDVLLDIMQAGASGDL